MKGVDVTDRVYPNDMDPFDSYRIVLKPHAHLHYSYAIRDGCMNIELSDYLDDAPDHVIRDTCKAVVSWAVRGKYNTPKSLMDLIHSEKFIVGKRPLYLERSRTVTMDQQGRCKNLLDSVERLRDNGLICDDDIRNSFFSWVDHMSKYKFGQCNQLFRVVTVNPVLDSDEVPDYVLDFVIYHEILHLRQDPTKNRRPHNSQFKCWERQFPLYDDAERYLKNFYL